MKLSKKVFIIALVVATMGAAIYWKGPKRRGWKLQSVGDVSASLWNLGVDLRLKYFSPAQTYSGTIDAISPTRGSFLLSISPTCGLPIIIDSEQQDLFLGGRVEVGDKVTVRTRTRISDSRKYARLYLVGLRVESSAFRVQPSTPPEPDFAEPIRLSLKSQRPSSEFSLEAPARIAPNTP